MNKTITEIILIILICLWFITIIIMSIWCEYKPKKYYKINYIFDNKGKSEMIIKARTPKQAIRKFINKYPHKYPLNEITDIISCKEINYYKCLKEVSKDD